MEMISIETMKSGLIAGAAVAAVSMVAVAAVGVLVNDHDGGLLGFAGKWGLIALMFGIAAAMGYGLLGGMIGSSGFLYLAVGLAAALTVMEFLPLYGASAFAPHWQVYAVLNFVFGLGFGYLVPKLMG